MCNKNYCVEEGWQYAHEEIVVVSFAYAVVKPHAVVIEFIYTAIASYAVLAIGEAVAIAELAE